MKDKVAIITGGAGGLGNSICQALAKKNVKIAVTDKDIERANTISKEISQNSKTSIAVEVDVTSKKSVYSTVNQVVRQFGRLDFLIHCAGNNISAPILELSEKDWKSVLDTHLTGAFLFCQAAGKQMVRQGEGGRVVLMSSVGARAPVPERGAYSPSKAGLIALAQMLSLEWAQHNINVNAICPGVTLTPMAKMVYKRHPELRETRLKRTPMGREATPKEIADLTVFLCSKQSSFINGAAIPVDGGFLNNGFMTDSQ